ncbi:hypothetical protein PROFUN_00819 [Planoprotostelium fungivorum]|uniref:Arrestin-like N-terminal domain-containing protein n=1 Tax=Planoprotostelium fungivorum TaxID=1890364 RepID=A0A2P6P004_9EUKA|nr:hypothetical protein PROFUN_00819 [Planoprotostelium fungivorum]
MTKIPALLLSSHVFGSAVNLEDFSTRKLIKRRAVNKFAPFGLCSFICVMSLPKITILFHDATDTFQAGQLISGIVVTRFTKEKKAKSLRLFLNGRAHSKWTYISGLTTNDDTKHSKIYEENQILSDEQTLPPGEHHYPFTLRLRPDLPSSFETTHGYIRYTFIAKLKRQWKSVKVSKDITVVAAVGHSVRSSSLSVVDHQKKPWHQLLHSGGVDVRLDLVRDYVCRGEYLDGSVSVDNKSSSKVKKMELSIIQRITHTVEGGTKEKKKTVHVSNELDQVKVKKRTSNFQRRFMLQTPSHLIPNIAPHHCKILQLELWTSSRFKVCVPFTLGTVSGHGKGIPAAQNFETISTPRPRSHTHAVRMRSVSDPPRPLYTSLLPPENPELNRDFRTESNPTRQEPPTVPPRPKNGFDSLRTHKSGQNGHSNLDTR